MRYQTVTIRGDVQLSIVVTRDHGYEPDTNAHEIEWMLDGDTNGMEQIALGLTEEEEEEITQQLMASSDLFDD